MMIQQVYLRYPEDMQAWQELYPQDRWTAVADGLCSEAIAGFRQFAAKYSGYFEQIISNGQFDRNQTTEDRLRAQFWQALNDYWSPLGEVTVQRRVKLYRDPLDEATKLAKVYLDKTKLGLPGVLIYFNKVTSIKYCPYTPIAFVGTPYTQLVYKDWMAIPHELGHYVYWNLGSNLIEVRQKHQKIKEEAAAALKEVPALKRLDKTKGKAAEDLLLSWLEETFCDIVGTRLGGVEFIKSLERLIKNSAGNVDELAENDGHHVPLCVRPNVREHTLRLNNGGASPVDWGRFFKGSFGVRSLDLLELVAPPPDIRRLIKRMLKKDLIELLVGEESSTTITWPSIQLQVDQIVPAVEALVKFLNAQLDELLEVGLPTPADPALTFDHLLALAEEDAMSTGKQPYEMLLHPTILEGADQHGPHTVRVHGRRHTVPVHNH